MTCIIKMRYLILVFVAYIIIAIGASEGNVEVEDYPSKVVIRAFGKSHVCAGVLISPKHVLTAAHCVLKENKKGEYLDANPTKAYKVIPFDATLNGDPTELKWRQDNEFWVSNVEIHKDRKSSSNLSADIAVLTLFVEIQENKTRMHALLPKSESVVGEEITALAYGFRYNTSAGVEDDETNVLKLATFKISNDSNCEYENSTKSLDELCATNSHLDTCYGYAGDSLKNSKNEVVGIISHPWNCTIGNIRVLNILPYKSWIEEIINNGSSSDTKYMNRMYTTFID